MVTVIMNEPDKAAETVFDQVSRELQFDHEDGQVWWGMFGQSLATLLKTTQYSEKEQLYYMRWFHRWIPSALGPRPVDGNPYHGATLTYDGSPLEYSLNWKEKKSSQLIRFTTEPTSREAGTASDALNQVASRDLLTSMAKEVQGIDLTRFHILLAETNVPDENAEQVLSKIPAGHPKVRVVVAYDLEDGAIVAKSYFNPEPRAIHDGTSPTTVAFDAVGKCNGPHGSYDASVEALRAHLDSRDAPGGPQIMLMAHDCVADSPSSRIKLYVVSPVRTLAAALDMFHLGGRLTGPIIDGGLEAVRSFWCHRFGLDSSSISSALENEEFLPAESICIFVYEMRPAKPGQQQKVDVEVKMHMPGTWLGKTDAEVGRVLSTWFQKHGHPDLAARYENDLASAFPKLDLNKPGDLIHTWVSLAHTPKTGLYMTMYYTPKITQFY